MQCIVMYKKDLVSLIEIESLQGDFFTNKFFTMRIKYKLENRVIEDEKKAI